MRLILVREEGIWSDLWVRRGGEDMGSGGVGILDVLVVGGAVFCRGVVVGAV